MRQETCKWEYIEDEEIYYIDCRGDSFEFFEETRRDKSFRFCPFCGREIKEVEE